MKRLSLTTRYRQGSFEDDARLVVLDDFNVTGAGLGEQVRDLIERRPLTKDIFIAAPFLVDQQLEQIVLEGLAVQRIQAQSSVAGPQVWVIDLRRDGTKLALTTDEQKALLKRLVEVDAFERFMHKAYLGQKQFSIEGLDMTVPMLDELIQLCAGNGGRASGFFEISTRSGTITVRDQ